MHVVHCVVRGSVGTCCGFSHEFSDDTGSKTPTLRTSDVETL